VGGRQAEAEQSSRLAVCFHGCPQHWRTNHHDPSCCCCSLALPCLPTVHRLQRRCGATQGADMDSHPAKLHRRYACQHTRFWAPGSRTLLQRSRPDACFIPQTRAGMVWSLACLQSSSSSSSKPRARYTSSSAPLLNPVLPRLSLPPSRLRHAALHGHIAAIVAPRACIMLAFVTHTRSLARVSQPGARHVTL
jgi:hypothetical protein